MLMGKGRYTNIMRMRSVMEWVINCIFYFAKEKVSVDLNDSSN